MDEKRIKINYELWPIKVKILSNPSKDKMIYTSSVGNIIHFMK